MPTAASRRAGPGTNGCSSRRSTRRTRSAALRSRSALVIVPDVSGAGGARAIAEPRGSPYLLEGQAARVERPRVEIVLELGQRAAGVVGEEVLDHPDLAVVVPGQVDVLDRDEVHGDLLAGRTPDRQPDRAVRMPGGQQPERRREDRPRALLGVAEEAP